MAHEYITYTTSELKELFASVGVPGVIISIDTESEQKTCDVATDKWGIIEDVPFFYHCEDNTTTKGYAAFQTESDDPDASQVMLLIKNGLNNDKKPNPTYDEIKVVGFYDGKLRKCTLPKILFRINPYAYSNLVMPCHVTAHHVHWNFYTKYDTCFVWDLETDSLDHDIRCLDTSTGKYSIQPIWPASYKKIKQESTLFQNYTVASSLPYMMYDYFFDYRSGYFLRGLVEENMEYCSESMGEQNILARLIEGGHNLQFGNVS